MTRSEAMEKLAVTNLIFEDVANLLDEVYTDFEEKTCDTCKYSKYSGSGVNIFCSLLKCECSADYGCNLFKENGV